MDYAEFDRLQAALNAVLDRHLGPGTKKQGSQPDADALGVMLGLTTPDGALDAMNRRAELERLHRLGRCAREFVKVWNSLHDDVHAAIINSSAGGRRAKLYLGSPPAGAVEGFGDLRRDDHPYWPGDLSKWGVNNWQIFWGVVSELDRLIEHAFPYAKELIDVAPEAGRRNMRAVNVIDELRIIWARRKKTPAPMSITDAGPFTDFIVESFEALGLEGSPRAAMDSWREYRAKHPKND